MMSSLIKHAALTTKIRSLIGKMLTDEDYAVLLSKTSVPMVAQQLKTYHEYGRVLETVDENSAHRSDLELCLQADIIGQFKKLYHFADSDSKPFLDVYLKRFELDLLKQIARSVETGHKSFSTVDPFIQRHVGFDIEALLAAKDLNELLELLSADHHYTMLYNILKARGEVSIFSFEMTLDLYMYNRVLSNAKKTLKGSDRTFAEKFFGSEADIMNLRWIYRCKANFKLDKELIYSYIIPYYYKVSQKTIQALVNASPETCRDMILATPYREIFAGEDFEREHLRYLKKTSKALMTQFPYSAVNILCYLRLKSIEAGNIVSIIEGIRYHLNADEIKEYLVL